MGVSNLNRALDQALDQLGAGDEEQEKIFDTSRLPDEEFFELRDLMERATDGGSHQPDGCKLGPEQRRRVRDLLGGCLPAGERVLVPWLLDDERLEVLDELEERMTDTRTGAREPEKWLSEEELVCYGEAAQPGWIVGRA